MARPARKDAQNDRFAGFRYTPGSAGRVDAEGRVTLTCLPDGELHDVTAYAKGYAEAKAEAIAGTAGNLPELVVRLQPGR